MIFRTYLYNYFDKENLNVKLYSKSLNGENFYEVGKNEDEFLISDDSDILGKVSGVEIIDKIINGELDGGTVGESSFVQAINDGLPIVAVAWLGYDSVPGKGFIVRGDLNIDSAEDLKGKTFISRRAGPGDAIFLREFFEHEGLDPDKDVKIIDQVNEDDSKNWLEEGKIDGGLYHLRGIKILVENGTARIYRAMDWMDSQLSFSILVFHKDFIEKHRDEVERFVAAYSQRIKYEEELPEEQKDESWDKSKMMKGDFEKMSIPSYDYPPYIKIDKLYQVQDLLIKYGYIKQGVKIEDYIDTSFVKEVN